MFTAIAVSMFSMFANIECEQICVVTCLHDDWALCGHEEVNGEQCARCECWSDGQPWPHWKVEQARWPGCYIMPTE